MTTAVIFLPLAALAAVLAMPANRVGAIRAIGVGTAIVEFALVVAMWVVFDPGGGVQLSQSVSWIPSVDVGYRVGVDGLSLPLIALTTVLFLATHLFSLSQDELVKGYVALFLFLETVTIGVFAALDLILFFVFWDLSLVAMYFVIGIWGHQDQERAALKFFLYTFLGSLGLLVGIIGLFVASEPRTFDMLALIDQTPLAGEPVLGGLVLLALTIGFAIKTPLVPVHTWLPPAHVYANAPASAILAGVMLKMGAYGFIRIAISMLPEQWHRWAFAALVVGVTSALYGAFVALGQTSFKRLVAYSSINHMGYILLALGAAGLVSQLSAGNQRLAIAGAITQMVAHGLTTGLLFLLTGVLWRRASTYEFAEFGGLAGVTPAFAGVTALAAFAGLGIPGSAIFIAELQMFIGVLDVTVAGVVLALVAVLVTAGLFLWTLHRLFMGPTAGRWRDMPDLHRHEAAATVPLLVAIVTIGVFPRWLLDVIEPAAASIAELLAP